MHIRTWQKFTIGSGIRGSWLMQFAVTPCQFTESWILAVEPELYWKKWYEGSESKVSEQTSEHCRPLGRHSGPSRPMHCAIHYPLLT